MDFDFTDQAASDVSRVAKVFASAAVVLTMSGLPQIALPFMPGDAHVINIDACGGGWATMELGGLETILTEHNATLYRRTLLRHGEFPKGPPFIDRLTCAALGDILVRQGRIG